MRVVVTFKHGSDREFRGASLASSMQEIDDRGTLKLIIAGEKKRRFIDLAGMQEIMFEYEPGDSVYEASLCGVELTTSQIKLAAPSRPEAHGHYDPGYRIVGGVAALYSDWQSRP